MRTKAQFKNVLRSWRRLFWLIGGVTAAGFALAIMYSAKPTISRVPIRVDDQGLEVEIADTQEKRARGLMWRTELPDGTGMLFIYDRPQHLAFWMKNTPIDLDIGFFGEDRRLQQIEAMRALDLTTHRSWSPARYALEVRRGWYADMGVSIGAQLFLPNP